MTTVVVQDATLRPVMVLDTWTSLDVTLAYNAVGSGELTAPATDALLTAVTSENYRISVIRNGGIFASGPIEKPPYQWSSGTGQYAGKGQVTVNFATNETYLAERVTYPDPTLASTAQTAVAAYTATAVNAEVAMRNLVNLNAGPGALVARRVSGLVLGTLASVGSNVNVSTRFEPLTDALRTIALAGGKLGFRLVESAGQLVFQVYAPPDLTGKVRFSAGLGNLRGLSTDPESPTCTVAIVGGSGGGAGRTIVERTPAGGTAWRRIEKWVNASNDTDTTVMAQDGDQALVDNGEKVNLSADAIDSQFARYGVDYSLGAKVSVELVPGVLTSDIVSTVKLTASPQTGELLVPTIGTGATSDTKTIAQARLMERRVGRLERG